MIVIDLDGTLCNSSHREHLAQNKQWDDFHAGLVNDAPHRDVQLLIEALWDRHDIVFLTGRSEAWRNQTLKWLEDHSIMGDTLLMRPDNDWSSDTVIKPQLLANHCLGMTDAIVRVKFILEDRDKMVECWRNLGFNCWQVRPGGY